MQRIRRKREQNVVESTPTGRVSRVRSARPSSTVKPRFIIDWDRSLGWKFQIYLVTSFLYYRLNRSLITDSDYDRLCGDLRKGWRTFRHPHKQYVDYGQLVSATGFGIVDYPLIVMGAADSMLANFREI